MLTDKQNNFILPDSETLKREEEAINLDGLNVAQMKEIREKVCKSVWSKMGVYHITGRDDIFSRLCTCNCGPLCNRSIPDF